MGKIETRLGKKILVTKDKARREKNTHELVNDMFLKLVFHANPKSASS